MPTEDDVAGATLADGIAAAPTAARGGIHARLKPPESKGVGPYPPLESTVAASPTAPGQKGGQASAAAPSWATPVAGDEPEVFSDNVTCPHSTPAAVATGHTAAVGGVASKSRSPVSEMPWTAQAARPSTADMPGANARL